MRRVSAAVALLCLAAAVVLVAMTAVRQFPRGLVFLALLVFAAVAAWGSLLRTGRARLTLWAVTGILLLGAVTTLLAADVEWTGIAAILVIAVMVVAARHAFKAPRTLLPVAPPKHAIVVWNPKSGGGKALLHNVADEARRRGIEPIQLKPGDDLVALVKDAVANGADALAAAGGDGTQALVATIAAEHDLPFACIPAGTRNHFALDLGVDRDDVVGALDAFVNGGEKRVDLGDVGGRTFVNNVSLGVYADAVQHEEYRGAKMRTLLSTASTTLARTQEGGQLHWRDDTGAEHHAAAVILVSNNKYRLGNVIGSGTRPRMDAGVLGVAAVGADAGDGGARSRAMRQWTTPEFTVTSDQDIPVGVDGEALLMPSPLVFRIRPQALRVRIAPQHPGASPSAEAPSGLVDGIKRLWATLVHG